MVGHRSMVAPMTRQGQARQSQRSESRAGAAKPERIAKVIARSGLCSRRAAEALIAEGRVRLNGIALETPAVTVTEADAILVDGKPLAAKEPARLWRYHKPSGLITTD